MRNNFPPKFSVKPKKRSCQGMTLLEIMVTTVISVSLLALLLSILSSTMGSLSATRGRVVAQRDANFALDVILKDMEMVTLPDFVSLAGLPAEGLRKESEMVNGADSSFLSLLTTAMDPDPDNDEGAVRAISYRLAFQDPVSGAGGSGLKRFSLYRSMASAEDTFQNVIGEANLNSWWGTAAPTPDVDDFLVGNVIGFDVRFQNKDGDWTSSNEGIRIGANGAYLTGSGGETQIAGGVTAVEVILTILSEEGALILGEIPQDELIQRFGYQYSRSTDIFSNPF